MSAAAGGAGAAAPSKDSLVKYESPALVTTKGRRPKLALPKLDRKAALPATEDILNAILPPREWTAADGQLWTQHVSSTPATRMDVVALQEQLDLKLQQKQARETGICPVREDLYAQCFDELIRQVTVNCAERGLLLLRVRDEIRMTLAAYQGLYESSIAFGMRKSLIAEQRKSELQARIKLLGSEVSELERTVGALTSKCEELETSDRERFSVEEERHRAEAAKLRAINDQLKETLEALLAPPSSAAGVSVSLAAGGKK